MYDALIDYLEKMQSVPMDMIFDRTFMTEEVYARLGYKDYSFTECFTYNLFRLENSINQQNMYLELAMEISKEEINYDNPIHVIPLAMDIFDYTEVKKYKKIMEGL